MRLHFDNRGSAVTEFGFTLPIFLALVVGIGSVGLGLYAQLALQHGAEMAARCASVNTTACGSVSQIQAYAVSHSYGLNPPASTFEVTTPACGNQVQASYVVDVNFAVFGSRSITLTSRSCYPR